MPKVIGIDGNEANIKNRVGSGQYGFELLKHLQRTEGEEVFWIYLKEKPLPDLPKESANWQNKVFGPKRLWTQFALPLNLYLQRPRPDVFFTPTHYAPRFCPVPLVMTIFDLSYIHFPQLFRKSDLYQLKNWTAYSVKKAKAILTISQASKNDIVQYYKIDPDKIFVIYPGYDKRLFRPITDQKVISQVKKKYGISGEYIFFLGTIQPRKNLIRLIDAVEQLEDITFVIAGKKGWLYNEFFKKIEDPKLRKKVIVTEFVPEQNLPVLFSGAKAFVLPSLWEGFGIPVLEAMSCGCPVIVSNVSSLPEVIGEAGILVDPLNVREITEGIQKVIELDSQKRQILIEKGTTSAEEVLEQFKKSLNEIVANFKKSPVADT